MQLKLFHCWPDVPREIYEEQNPNFNKPHYNWRCRRCGRRGMATVYHRPDLVEWAEKNHVCPPVEIDRLADY